MPHKRPFGLLAIDDGVLAHRRLPGLDTTPLDVNAPPTNPKNHSLLDHPATQSSPFSSFTRFRVGWVCPSWWLDLQSTRWLLLVSAYQAIIVVVRVEQKRFNLGPNNPYHVLPTIHGAGPPEGAAADPRPCWGGRGEGCVIVWLGCCTD